VLKAPIQRGDNCAEYLQYAKDNDTNNEKSFDEASSVPSEEAETKCAKNPNVDSHEDSYISAEEDPPVESEQESANDSGYAEAISSKAEAETAYAASTETDGDSGRGPKSLKHSRSQRSLRILRIKISQALSSFPTRKPTRHRSMSPATFSVC